MAPPAAVYSFTVEERLQSVKVHGLGSDIINSVLYFATILQAMKHKVKLPTTSQEVFYCTTE